MHMDKKTIKHITSIGQLLAAMPLMVFAVLLLFGISSCKNGTNDKEDKTSLASLAHKEKKSDIRLALVPLIDCLPIYYAHDS